MKIKKLSFDLNKLISTYNIDNLYEQYKRFEFLHKLNVYVNLNNSNILEFGSASGQMTEILAKIAKKIVAVDGSSDFIKIAKERVHHSKNVEFHETYFENFKSNEKFDCLILHHILEHVMNPVALLKNLHSFLHLNSYVAISVPNAHALSRQLAVRMNLLSSVYKLTSNDINHGHMRVYDWNTLENEIKESGFEIVGKHGLSFKLFSDKQNVDMLNANILGEEQIKGLWLLADDFPQFAGAIMIIAKTKKNDS